MSRTKWMLALLITLLVGVAVGLGLQNLLDGPANGSSDDESTGPARSESAREILYWVAPMDPNYRRDGPGKSPMGMDLVPVYAEAGGADGGVRISPAVQNNLGVRTEKAAIRPLWRRIEATGYVGIDETRISHINLRAEGWIVNLKAGAEGERVVTGELLFELYSPELVNAQKEFLQAAQRGGGPLQAGAAEKLRALGMIPQDIDELAERGTPTQNIRVVAPQDGVVIALGVREGMFVKPETSIMSLADLSTVWLQAAVFESQADAVATGQAAEARLEYLPGAVFTGQVDYVYPVLDPVSRTLKVRLRFDNLQERLKPNMYARVSIYGRLKPNALSIPREALIPAPGMDRVVVRLDDGQFHVQEVMTGLESGDFVEIIAGLSEGDEVVTSAQFLIDSEASLAGSIHRLDAITVPEEREPEPAFGSGRIEAVDLQQRRLRIAHGPIDALGWPSMTMDFPVRAGVNLSEVEAGEKVRFELVQEHAGEYAIRRIFTGAGAGADESGESARPGESVESVESVPGQHQHGVAEEIPQEPPHDMKEHRHD